MNLLQASIFQSIGNIVYLSFLRRRMSYPAKEVQIRNGSENRKRELLQRISTSVVTKMVIWLFVVKKPAAKSIISNASAGQLYLEVIRFLETLWSKRCLCQCPKLYPQANGFALGITATCAVASLLNFAMFAPTLFVHNTH